MSDFSANQELRGQIPYFSSGCKKQGGGVDLFYYDGFTDDKKEDSFSVLSFLDRKWCNRIFSWRSTRACSPT